MVNSQLSSRLQHIMPSLPLLKKMLLKSCTERRPTQVNQYVDCGGESRHSEDSFLCEKCNTRLRKLDKECGYFFTQRVFSLARSDVDQVPSVIHPISGLPVKLAALTFADEESKLKLSDALLHTLCPFLVVVCASEDTAFHDKVCCFCKLCFLALLRLHKVRYCILGMNAE